MTRFLAAAGLAAALALSLLPVGAHEHEHPAGLHVHDAYVRTMGNIGGSGAAFMVIHNNTEADDRLIAAASDAAGKVELHTHVEKDGVMQMVEVPEGFAIEAGGFRELARGGDHVMLLGLTRALADGDIVTLTLTFASGAVLTVAAPVDNAREDAGGHGGHDGHGHGHQHGQGG